MGGRHSGHAHLVTDAFRAALRAHLEREGLSQAEFGESIGVGKGTISNILQARHPGSVHLPVIARAIGVDLEGQPLSAKAMELADYLEIIAKADPGEYDDIKAHIKRVALRKLGTPVDSE